MSKMKLEKVKTGSVKNIYSDGSHYYFHYSDRYSIFDWGEMPDQLINKGKSLAHTANLFFTYFGQGELWNLMSESALPKDWSCDQLSLLKKNGLSHHCIGLVNQDGEECDLAESDPMLKVKPVNVVPPTLKENGQYDYSFYSTQPKNTLVPLEVIFRFGVPQGSSLLRRLKRNPEYASELGLKNLPKEGDVFDAPLIEFSTKLEPSDTYLTKETAFSNAGLSPVEAKRLYSLTFYMALKLKDLYSSMGLELWDGKFEFSFADIVDGDREFMWVDSMGPDEIRLLKNGVQLSKEYLRQAYDHTDWLKRVIAIKEHQKTGWKDQVNKEFPAGPPKLSIEHKTNAENIYMGLTNGLAEQLGSEKVFKECPHLSAIAEHLRND